MKKKRAIVFLSFVIFGAVIADNIQAQQDAMFTHYMDNTLEVNPAYAGSRDAMTLTLLSRNQWVDFDGAPTTQTFTIHSPVVGEKVNLGFSVINDRIGPISNTNIYCDYAYRINLSPKYKLSLGLKAGFGTISTDLLNLVLDEQGDEVFLEDLNHKILPNLGFGLYLSSENFYAGVSVPKLFNNSYLIGESDLGNVSIYNEKRHYYFIAGSLKHLTTNLDFKPTSFVKVTSGAPVEVDLTGSFIFNDKFLLGGMFRMGDALGLLAGFNVAKNLYLGYSFDWSYYNKTFRYNTGTHELILRYDFELNDSRKIRSPRYF